MNLKSMLGAIALMAASLSFVPAASNALTVLNDGGLYTLDTPGAAPFVGNVDGTGAAGTFTATFNATPVAFGTVSLSINAAFLGLFDDLKVEWQTVGGVVLEAIDPILVGLVELTTTFDAVNSTQKLVFSWTDSDEVLDGNGNPLGFDFSVDPSPVPLPAGILLMGTALAGFGVMRRRKQRA